MPESVASWKHLVEQDLEVNAGARMKLAEIGRTYRAERRRMLKAQRRFKTTGETDIPVPLKSCPYDHQTRAFGFASSLDGSGCFADQGTGKTLIAIAVAGKKFLDGILDRVLVVTPKTVKQVWPRQLLEHADYEWMASVGKNPPVARGCQFWIVSYDQVKGLMKDIKRWKPGMVIWDESHRLKNPKTTRYKSNRDATNRIPVRLLLSGTPIGKCISEAWSQYYLIDKSVFGTYNSFKTRYLKMGGYMGHSVVGYNNLDEFYEKFHSKTFRVTKEECLDLPPISYQNIYVEASGPTRKQYNEFASKLWMETGQGEVTSSGAAVTAMKLRQIAGGSIKTDEGVVARLNDDKLAAFKDFMEDRLDRKTVVFFSFTHEIRNAENALKKMGIHTMTLEGSSKDRESFETRFQGYSGPCVALIQVQTGAEGLTLHSADYALYYSPSYSFIWYSQSRDRIYRIGQLKNVTIGFLIVLDTVDENVVAVLQSNGRLVKTTLEDNRNYKLEITEMAKAPVAGYTAALMAEALGIETKDLRMHLRALKIDKPEAGWVWPKKGDAKDIEKAVTARIKDLANKAKNKADTKPEPVADKGKGKGKGKLEEPVNKGKGKEKAEPSPDGAKKKKPKGGK